MVNRAFVSVQAGTGSLINNANSTNGIAASRFKLIATDNTPPQPPPATGKLRSKQNNLHVVHTSGDPELKCTANNAGDAASFEFERVASSPDNAPTYTIKSAVNNMFVTANNAGTSTLKAASGVAQAWEYYRLVSYQGGFIVIHAASGKAVKLQPDGTLIDNATAIDNNSVWDIV